MPDPCNGPKCTYCCNAEGMVSLEHHIEPERDPYKQDAALLTQSEFMQYMLQYFPFAELVEDNDGQLLIATGLQMGAHPTLAAGDPIPESHYVTVPMED